MIWLLAGMFLVTYLPRLIPLLILSGQNGDKPLPSWLTRWLGYVPVAVLAAMLISRDAIGVAVERHADVGPGLELWRCPMSAFATHFSFEFRTGIRNKTV